MALSVLDPLLFLSLCRKVVFLVKLLFLLPGQSRDPPCLTLVHVSANNGQVCRAVSLMRYFRGFCRYSEKEFDALGRLEPERHSMNLILCGISNLMNPS